MMCHMHDRRPIRGVLFDLDHTLLDNTDASAETWPRLLQRLAATFPAFDADEFERRLAVVEDEVSARHAGRELSRDERRFEFFREWLRPWGEPDEELFRFYDDLRREAASKLVAVAGAKTVIRQLRDAGLKVGVLSNGEGAAQRQKLDQTGLAAEFDAVAISDEIGYRKPDPAAFSTAAAMIGCEVHEVAMIGNGVDDDLAGALAAGLARAISIDPELAGAGFVARLDDLPAALQPSP